MLVLWSLLLVWYVDFAVFLFTKTHINATGTVTVTRNVTDYAFGAEGRLLVFNLTDMGGVAGIHQSEKQHATMKTYGQKYDGTSFDGEVFDVGFEYKGMSNNPRPKHNFKFEMWQPDDDGWDEDKEKLFFSEKMEDFVLRGGYFEPTLTRDAVASRLAGVAYETALTAVVFVLPGDVFTYEGVYLLMQGVKRRQIEKNAELSVDGKKVKCEDMVAGQEAAAVQEVMFVMEVDGTSAPARARGSCNSVDSLVLDYPKCEFVVNETSGACAAAYQAEATRLAQILYNASEEVPAEIEASLVEMAHVTVAGLFFADDGFGVESFFVFAHPLAGGTTRSFGFVLYDNDELGWRVVDTGSTPRLPRRWPDYDYMPAHKRVLHYEAFVDIIQANASHWVQEMNATVQAALTEREAQLNASYWDDNNARWPLYGTKSDYGYGAMRVGLLSLWDMRAVIPKDTMQREIDWARKWYQLRAQAIVDWAPAASKVVINDRSIVYAIVERALLAALALALVIVLTVTVVRAIWKMAVDLRRSTDHV